MKIKHLIFILVLYFNDIKSQTIINDSTNVAMVSYEVYDELEQTAVQIEIDNEAILEENKYLLRGIEVSVFINLVLITFLIL